MMQEDHAGTGSGVVNSASGNGDEPFEVVPPIVKPVDDDKKSGSGMNLPAPSALPAFASMNTTTKSLPTGASGDKVVAPPSVPAPPRPPPTVESGTSGNPFSIASAGGTTLPRLPMANQPPPNTNVPVSIPSTVPISTAVSAGLTPPTVPATVGVDLSDAMAQLGVGPPQSAVPSDPTQGDEQGGWGLGGWIKDTVAASPLLSNLAEKAKTGVDTMITTLDPQMKEYMFASGAVEIAIASDKESKIVGIKDGFQKEFTTVVVRGLGAPGMSTAQSIAVQPVGFDNGKKGAEKRIELLRQSGLVQDDGVIVGVENFVVEVTKDCWLDIGCVILDDAQRNIKCITYTQPTVVPEDAVRIMQSHTPSDYPQRSSGFAVTVGQAMAECEHVNPCEWHEHVCALTRTQLITTAAHALARQYKRAGMQLNAQQQQQTGSM